MAEYSQAPFEEPLLSAVAFGELILEERDGGLRRSETNRHQAMPLLNGVTPQIRLWHDSRPCGKERKGWDAEISWSAPEMAPRAGLAAVDKKQMHDGFAADKKRNVRLDSKRL